MSAEMRGTAQMHGLIGEILVRWGQFSSTPCGCIEILEDGWFLAKYILRRRPGGNSSRAFPGQLSQQLSKGNVSCLMGGTFVKPGAKCNGSRSQREQPSFSYAPKKRLLCMHDSMTAYMHAWKHSLPISGLSPEGYMKTCTNVSCCLLSIGRKELGRNSQKKKERKERREKGKEGGRKGGRV